MLNRILPNLTRIPGSRRFWRRFPVGSTALRVRYGIFKRPHYAYGVYAAADLARRLDLDQISVLELGVAGGRGLLVLEAIAAEVSRALSIRISVYGFDSGNGMPPSSDYRDLPYVWGEGNYRMDEAALRASLKHAQLILGDVAETIPQFMAGSPAPLGFVSFDLDYYSSTKAALRLFDGDHPFHLPRTFCYFDDMVWPERAYHSEYLGELCAIREFNSTHATRKLSPIHMLSYTRPQREAWNEQIYVMHDFEHPLYCVNVTPQEPEFTEMPM